LSRLLRRLDLRWAHVRSGRSAVVLDIVFVAATLLFFGLAAAYVAGCERVK
jgi:hypothetical protein